MNLLKLESFGRIQNLPTPPEQLARVLDEVAHTSAMDYNILKMIQYDLSIATRVLQVANRPFYGFGSQVDSLQQAAGLLGPSIIKSIILTAPILTLPGSNGTGGDPTDLSKVWIHSAVTATLAMALARNVKNLESDVCFTAGLIHDIGIIALMVQAPELMEESVDYGRRKRFLLSRAVQENVGFSLGDIAATMAASWGYPERLVRVLSKGWGDPLDGPEDRFVAVVLLAKHLSCQWGYTDDFETGPLEDPERYLKILGMSESGFERLHPQLKQEARDIADTII